MLLCIRFFDAACQLLSKSKSMKATLTTLTPVHVGNGVTYNKGIDFIQLQDKIGIIDEMKFLSWIGKENINQWVSVINNYNPDIDYKTQPILDLLTRRGKMISDLMDISSRVNPLISLNNRSKQLKEQFRSPLSGITIPGSSLKGALRTAILDELTQKHFNFHVSDIKYEKYDRRKDQMVISWKFDRLDKKIFGETANDKSTRFIQCGDIHFPEIKSEIHEVKILNYEEDEWRFKAGQHFLIEAIPAGVSGCFTFKRNTSLFEQNKKNQPQKWPKESTHFLMGNIQDFCDMINRVTAELIEWEFDVLENESMIMEGTYMLDEYEKILNLFENLNSNEFIVRIGANSGWIFMTAGWWRRFWDDFSDDEKVSIRKAIQKKRYPDLDFWPKTRKISKEGIPFGFVKVTLQE